MREVTVLPQPAWEQRLRILLNNRRGNLINNDISSTTKEMLASIAATHNTVVRNTAAGTVNVNGSVEVFTDSLQHLQRVSINRIESAPALAGEIQNVKN